MPRQDHGFYIYRKVDGPGNVVTILMSQTLSSTSDAFVTKNQ
jgi:hypothetical protein